MNCREALDLIGEHVDETLAFRARWRLRLHLWICRLCRRYLASYRAAVRAAKLSGGGPSDASPADLPDALRHAILAALRSGEI